MLHWRSTTYVVHWTPKSAKITYLLELCGSNTSGAVASYTSGTAPSVVNGLQVVQESCSRPELGNLSLKIQGSKTSSSRDF